jgi:3-oxoadipate enol-lactonase
MWALQLPALAEQYRVLQFSYPGHGQSAPVQGEGSVAELAKGAMELIDGTGADRFSVVGLSLGGTLGLHLAATMPSRVKRVVVSCCRYYQTPDLAKQWDARIKAVQAQGMAAVVEPTLERWLGAEFRQANPALTEQVRAMIAGTSAAGFAYCAAAVRDFDGRGLLADIAAPVLVISGDNDLAAPSAHLLELTQALPHAQHKSLPGSHLVNIECAAGYNQLITNFLTNND